VTNGEILPIVGVENSIHILSADESLLTQTTRSKKGSKIKTTLKSRCERAVLERVKDQTRWEKNKPEGSGTEKRETQHGRE